MKFRLALVLLPLALAACDEQAMQDLRMPWDQPLDATPEPAAPPVDPMQIPLVDPEVSPTQVPMEVEGQRNAVATAESTTLNTMAFTASGNEPFWRVDVAEGTARYATPDNQSGRNISVNRIVYRQGVEYVGTLNGLPFTLNIRNVACQDSMSGDTFPMTALLRSGSQRMQGCARPAVPATPENAQAPATRPEQG
ncbi:COG3650 family protein [Paracoccus aerodenitrificans]|uniref:COG3650 family protein n=1 Tax=Paracoccus aerodenitrificans TaxID=3017781 RepID=UPI0022F01C16|nr:hypothetical protein [Paracoccus aerodenitrificans]WBU62958.1 hypothetical protein PAE61_11340 [Paracoccus aerodenitrificans]